MGDFAHERKHPQLMLDLEFGLVCMIEKSLNVGNPIRTSTLKEMCSDLYLGLRALAIHDDAGEGLGLGDVSEHVSTLIAYVTSRCPWCKVDIVSDTLGLYSHIHYCHV